MCGFVGISRRGSGLPVDRDDIERMLATIRHRGPDGEGFHFDADLGLGFCRLAIIDLEKGDQPLSNEDGSIWIVFNGEIYNFRELTGILRDRGHRFSTRCDTETVVHAYEEWGEACVERLRGIFAFAIWDRSRRRLFLANDRSGIKPLYLAVRSEEIVFASEAKAVLAYLGGSSGLDLLGFLGGVETDPGLARTPFQGIHQLGGGCTLTVEGNSEALRRYWSYRPSERAKGGDPEALLDSFRRVFHETVGMQLMSDVPVAVSLSGGLDSSAVAASVFHHGRTDVMTYTVLFEDDDTGDVRHARLLADALGVPNKTVPCPMASATSGEIPLVAWLAEGDFDLGFVARYRLAKAVYADGAKVLLSGQGIDEILTGYQRSYDGYHRQVLLRYLDAGIIPVRPYPVFGERALDEVQREFSTPEPDSDGNTLLSELTAKQLRREHSGLQPYLLRFEDRMGMAGQVEVRVPYLDHVLIELCASASDATRKQLFSGKSLLRRVVGPWLPDEIAQRPKDSGFNTSAPRLTRLVLEQPDCELANLLSREVVESKSYFDWRYCSALLRAQEYDRLDSLFIVHLLDDLFVSNFDAARYSAAA